MAEKDNVSILLIDDLEENRFLIRSFLKKINLSVTEADSGFKGLDLFRDKWYAVVLLDIHMPEMDGYEVAKSIREWEREKGLPKSRIIAVTAYAWENDEKKMISKGFDMYIPKPIEKNQFLDLMKDICC